MATFQKLIPDNDYCQGGSTVYCVALPKQKVDDDRCQNSIMGDVLDGRLDDTQYYGKKPETRAFSSAFGPAFG